MNYARVDYTPILYRLPQSPEGEKVEELLQARGIRYEVKAWPDDPRFRYRFPKPKLDTPIGEFLGIDEIRERFLGITASQRFQVPATDRR